MAKQKGLGKGLDALIPQSHGTAAPVLVQTASSDRVEQRSDSSAKHEHAQDASVGSAGSVRRVPIDQIVPNPHQPRTYFDPQSLADLTASIKEHGVLQPLIVTTRAGSGYELLAGERRLRASKEAGLTDVPVLVRSASEQEKLELAILENVQRHDLNPIEEAKAYMRLIDEFQFTQEDVAKRIGKQRSSVANIVRLLQLPRAAQEALSAGTIRLGHAKVLLSLESREACLDALVRVTKQGWSVRELERFVKGEPESEASSVEDPQTSDSSVFASSSPVDHVHTSEEHGHNDGTLQARAADGSVFAKSSSGDATRSGASSTVSLSRVTPELKALADALQTTSGMPVTVKPTVRGGSVVFQYFSEEELQGLLEQLQS